MENIKFIFSSDKKIFKKININWKIKKKVIEFDKGTLNQKELKWEEEERDLIQEEML